MSSVSPDPQSEIGALARKLDELSAAQARLEEAVTASQKREAEAQVDAAEDAVAAVAKARGISRDEAEQAIEHAKDEADYKNLSRHFERWLKENNIQIEDVEDSGESKADGHGDGDAHADRSEKKSVQVPPDSPPTPEPHWSDRKLTDLLR